MWEQYKKHLLAAQIGIALICTGLAYKGIPWHSLIAYFFIMQVANFLGAAWGARLKRKFEASNDRQRLNVE